MTGIKSSIKFTSLFFAVPLTIAIVGAAEVFSPLAIRSQAQSQQANINQRLITNWGAYEPDPNIGKPERREGGGTRGPCIEKSENNNLVPLVPNNSFGATVSEYPTFLVYVPAINKQEKPQIKFTLQGANNQEIYTSTATITNTAGIISIRLPGGSNLPGLETGKTYKWSFTLICYPEQEQEGDHSGNSQVQGSIGRVENPALVQQLEQITTPRDKFLTYAAAGVWYDALSALAELRRSQPDNPILAKDWQDLLQSVGLETIAAEPLLTPVAADRALPSVSRN